MSFESAQSITHMATGSLSTREKRMNHRPDLHHNLARKVNGTLAASTYVDDSQNEWIKLFERVFLDRPVLNVDDLEYIRYHTPFGLNIIDLDEVNAEKEKLISWLMNAFDAEPLENGVTHPAEEIISKFLLKSNGPLVYTWLEELIVNTTRPAFVSSIILCLGRFEQLGTADWRATIIRQSLASENIEIRDAAAQAAESWGGYSIRDILLQHNEQILWLRDYIHSIIEDMEN